MIYPTATLEATQKSADTGYPIPVLNFNGEIGGRFASLHFAIGMPITKELVALEATKR